MSFHEDAPSEAGLRAAATPAWAGKRMGLQIGVTSDRDARSETVVKILVDAGVHARIVEGTAEDGEAGLTWLAPGQ